MRLVAISVLFSLSVSAQNSTCIPLLAQGVGVAQDMSNDLHQLVYGTIPEGMKTIQKFTDQLSETTHVIDSKASYGFFAGAGAVVAVSGVFVVLVSVAIWKCGGERIMGKINAWTDQRVGDGIRRHVEAQAAAAAAAAPITVQVQ
ncbi:MAG: hypothetical protein WCK42_03490 [Myxococcaceae bacterium]